MARNDAHRLSAGSLTFEIDHTGNRGHLVADSLRSVARGRFWTLSLTHGEHRDCAVHSEDQSGVVTSVSDGLRIDYSVLRTASGERLEATLQVRVHVHYDELVFEAEGSVGEGVTIREIALPVVELAPSETARDEVLYRPEGLGRRIPDPRQRLYRAHTEYMVDDSAGVWEMAAYPGELSMAWQGLQTQNGFLYMGRHDPEFSSVLMGAGVPPRGHEGELWLSTVTPSGRRTFSAGPVVLTLTDGRWQAGASRYRTWADNWYTGPHRDAPRGMNGWQRIIMRHQFGQVLFRYDELVDVFERGRARGLDGIVLFGWWRGGFDRGYPSYEPDDELGGREALVAAIREIQSRGGFVSLYANGNLVDRTTDFYASTGSSVTKKDSRGLDYVVGYDFAGESRTMRHFSASSFVVACHGAPAWRETMIDVARVHASLGTNSVFFDQTAYHMAAWPCYDTSHEHGPRTGIEVQLRGRTLDAIRAAAGGATLGSEGMSDCLISRLDFHHGWGFAFQDEPEAFPALFRTVFPEPVVSNRLLHDERAGWADQLNYAFVYNLAFDVSIHRGRAAIDASSQYADRVEHLTSLRRAHRRFFVDGHFEYEGDEGGMIRVRYVCPDASLEIYWNRGDHLVSAAGGQVIDPHDIAVLVSEGAR